MAKSARASSRKSARVNTRAKVFLPAYDARTARLSEKLQQIATEKKPTDVNVMEVDTDATKEGEQAEVAMEVDGEAATTKQPTASAMRRLAAKARPRKRVSKSQKSIVFQKKQHKGKGDSIGRVGKR